jgi:hypothetical protein
VFASCRHNKKNGAKKKKVRTFVTTKQLRAQHKVIKNKVGWTKGQYAYLWDAENNKFDDNVAHVEGEDGKKVGILFGI